MLTEKYKVAMKVMAIVKKMLNTRDRKEESLLAECYDNCREQGFCITNLNDEMGNQRSVWFSENRNSDDIVVYKDKKKNFNNDLTDDAYKNAKYFRYDKVEEASNYIVNYLTGKE